MPRRLLEGRRKKPARIAEASKKKTARVNPESLAAPYAYIKEGGELVLPGTRDTSIDYASVVKLSPYQKRKLKELKKKVGKTWVMEWSFDRIGRRHSLFEVKLSGKGSGPLETHQVKIRPNKAIYLLNGKEHEAIEIKPGGMVDAINFANKHINRILRHAEASANPPKR